MLEFVIDVLGEVFIELFAEGAVEASQNSRVPRPIRIVLTAVIGLFALAILGVAVAACVYAFQEDVGMGLLVLAVVLLMVFGLVTSIRKQIRKKKKEL